MTNTNSILNKNSNAIRELIAIFTSENLAHVCGELKFVNKFNSDISSAELGY